MRSIAFVFVVVAAAAVVQGELTDEQKAKFLEYHKKCSADTGVELEAVKKFKAGDFSAGDDNGKKYVFCIMKEIGVMDADGEFQKEVFMSKLTSSADKLKAEQALNECLAEARPPTSEEYSWNLAKCYQGKGAAQNII